MLALGYTERVWNRKRCYSDFLKEKKKNSQQISQLSLKTLEIPEKKKKTKKQKNPQPIAAFQTTWYIFLLEN